MYKTNTIRDFNDGFVLFGSHVTVNPEFHFLACHMCEAVVERGYFPIETLDFCYTI